MLPGPEAAARAAAAAAAKRRSDAEAAISRAVADALHLLGALQQLLPLLAGALLRQSPQSCQSPCTGLAPYSSRLPCWLARCFSTLEDVAVSLCQF